MIRLVIADDHPIVRAGLRAVFGSDERFEVVADVASAEEAIALCAAGVLAIGGVNLLVSFSLALFTAMKARRIRFSDSRPLFGRIVRRLLRHPGDFVLPPAAGREDTGNTAV